MVSWEIGPGAQPAIMLDEFVECEAASARPPLAGGDAETRNHRLQPVHGGPLVGRQLRLAQEKAAGCHAR